MDETRESCLAAILARGVLRVLRSRERAGTQKPQCDEELQQFVARDEACTALLKQGRLPPDSRGRRV